MLLLALAPDLQAQDTGSIVGRVMDDQTLAPVSDVLVRVRDTDIRGFTNEQGRFTLANVPSGRHVLVLEHLAFGDRADSVVVRSGRVTQLEIQMSTRAIDIDPLLVEAPTELQARRRSTGAAMHEIMRPTIDAAARRGETLSQLLRDEMPALRVEERSYGFMSCVEFRGGTGMAEGCRMMAIFVDGMYMSAPGTLPPNIPLNDVERVEAISPGQAGVQYGTLGGYGVLLIETRTGPSPFEREEREETLIGFDWSLETQPYPWARVLGLSFLGNAIGLGVGMAAAKYCLDINNGMIGVRHRCNALASIGVGSLAVGLPTLVGSLGARQGGQTERSRGRVIPTAVLGSISALTGYLLLVEGQNAGAAVMLGVGAPLLMTFADRAFRVLR